jgi:hypothetical protein
MVVWADIKSCLNEQNMFDAAAPTVAGIELTVRQAQPHAGHRLARLRYNQEPAHQLIYCWTTPSG